MTVAEKILRAKADYEAVYEAGKKSEYDAFWDVYQGNGNSKQYHYAFAGYGWTDETFKPKHNIIMQGSCLAAFQYSKITDIAERLKECGVELDTSNCSNFQAMFAYATTKSLPTINTLKAVSLTSLFADCKNLERVEKLVVKKGSTYGTGFKGCQALKDIVFEGEIGNDISFSDSPLSKASIENIVEHLSDTTTGKTLTLNKAAVESAFPSEEVVELTPFDGVTHASEGIDLIDNGDGSITANGTSESYASFRFKEFSLEKGVEYIFSAEYSSNHSGTACPIFVYDKDGNMIGGAPVSPNSPYTFTADSDGYYAEFTFEANAYGEYDNLTVCPKLTKKVTWDALIATKPNWTITLV